MNDYSLLNKIERHFKVSHANLGNFPYKCTLGEDSESGEAILPMPKEAYGDYAEVDDVISFKKPSKHRIEMINLSCKYRKKTAFIREYNSCVIP